MTKVSDVNETALNKTSLVSRNITIFGRRTSVRLEPEMWDALKDISTRECCSVHDICSLIYYRKRENTSLTAAIRVFIMLYYKAASTEEGHKKVGHGNFENMKKRAGVVSILSKGQDKPLSMCEPLKHVQIGSTS